MSVSAMVIRGLCAIVLTCGVVAAAQAGDEEADSRMPDLPCCPCLNWAAVPSGLSDQNAPYCVGVDAAKPGDDVASDSEHSDSTAVDECQDATFFRDDEYFDACELEWLWEEILAADEDSLAGELADDELTGAQGESPDHAAALSEQLELRTGYDPAYDIAVYGEALIDPWQSEVATALAAAASVAEEPSEFVFEEYDEWVEDVAADEHWDSSWFYDCYLDEEYEPYDMTPALATSDRDEQQQAEPGFSDSNDLEPYHYAEDECPVDLQTLAEQQLQRSLELGRTIRSVLQSPQARQWADGWLEPAAVVAKQISRRLLPGGPSSADHPVPPATDVASDGPWDQWGCCSDLDADDVPSQLVDAVETIITEQPAGRSLDEQLTSEPARTPRSVDAAIPRQWLVGAAEMLDRAGTSLRRASQKLLQIAEAQASSAQAPASRANDVQRR